MLSRDPAPSARCPGPPSAPPTTTKGRHRPHLSESSAGRRVPRPSPLVPTPRAAPHRWIRAKRTIGKTPGGPPSPCYYVSRAIHTLSTSDAQANNCKRPSDNGEPGPGLRLPGHGARRLEYHYVHDRRGRLLRPGTGRGQSARPARGISSAAPSPSRSKRRERRCLKLGSSAATRFRSGEASAAARRRWSLELWPQMSCAAAHSRSKSCSPWRPKSRATPTTWPLPSWADCR